MHNTENAILHLFCFFSLNIEAFINFDVPFFSLIFVCYISVFLPLQKLRGTSKFCARDWFMVPLYGNDSAPTPSFRVMR